MTLVYKLSKSMQDELVALEQAGGTPWSNFKKGVEPIWPNGESSVRFANRSWTNQKDIQLVLDTLAKETLRVRIADLIAASELSHQHRQYAKLKGEIFENPYADLYDIKHTYAQLQALYNRLPKRHLLNLEIQQARSAYPRNQWEAFSDLTWTYYTDMDLNRHEWWKKLDDERAASYLKMLKEPDLNKVKMKMGHEEPLPAPTLVQRKATFLCLLKSKPEIVPLLGSYMDQRVPGLSFIAEKVAATDEDQFAKWEGLLNEGEGSSHIMWQLIGRVVDHDDEEILKRLADLKKSADDDGRSIQQRILYFWSTYQEEKKELILAYLARLPFK